MRMERTKAIAERKAFNFYSWYDDILESLDNKTAQAFLASLLMYAFQGEENVFDDEKLQADFQRVKKQIDKDREKAVRKISQRGSR
nr:MAG TPA: hypothetical protein [Caudoviricetes sp.]